MRLNPQHPPGYLFNLGFAYRVAGRYDEALVPLKKVLSLNPDDGPAHVNLAACYVELGRMQEAQAEAAKASVEDEKARAMQELKRDLFEIYYSSRPAQS